MKSKQKIEELEIFGVLINSRYGEIDEIIILIEMAKQIQSINLDYWVDQLFYDSKSCTITVYCRKFIPEYYEELILEIIDPDGIGIHEILKNDKYFDKLTDLFLKEKP